MLYLPFIISNILSAAVSAAVTVYLLRYFILKHKDEFFGDFKVNQDTKELRNDTTIVERSPDISKKDEGQVKSIEENILSSFTQVHQESKRVRLNRFSNVFTTLTDFFSNTFKNLNFILHRLVHTMSTGVDSLLMGTFWLLGEVLGFILQPTYSFFYKLSIFRLGSPFKSVYKKYKDILSNLSNLRREYIKNRQQKIQVAEAMNSSNILEVKEAKISQEKVEEVKRTTTVEANNVSNNLLHFSVELYLSALFVVATFFPFVFKLHLHFPNTVLFYCLFLLTLGSYTLLYKNSSRVFWAIGVSMWVMLALWYFDVGAVVGIGSVIMFLCAFLSVYAFSSFIWYGLRSKQASLIEYGLFVLHPFLYLAGVYLLLIEGSKYFVVLLCAAVAACYIYFAQEVKNKNLVSKTHTDFVYTSYFVSLVSVLALVCVATEGFLTVLTLAVGTLLYLRFAKKIEITFLIILLLTIFGQTLGTTNTSTVYSFIANERFVSYITAASIFVYIINTVRNRRGLLPDYIKTFATIILAFTVFFGATVEILDAKVNSNIFAKGAPEIVLAGIYLLITGYLFYSADKRKVLGLKVVAVLFSIYSLYFITTKLLG